MLTKEAKQLIRGLVRMVSRRTFQNLHLTDYVNPYTLKVKYREFVQQSHGTKVYLALMYKNNVAVKESLWK